MDKNTIIGFILIAAVLIGFNIYSQPSAEERAAQARQDSIAAVTRQKAEQEAKAAATKKTEEAKAQAIADTTALFHSALNGTKQSVILKNDKVELTVSTKGATVEKAVIKNFDDRNGNKNVTLFDSKDQQLSFILLAKETNISTADLYFQPSEVTDTSVTLTAVAQNGKDLTLRYTLGKDYMLHMQLQATGMQGLFSPSYNQMDVDWSDRCRQQERGFTFENRYASLTYHKTEGGTKYLSETSKDEKTPEEKIDWVAFKNQFFSAVMIAKNDFAPNAMLTSTPEEKGSGYLKQYQAKMKTFFDPSGRTPTEIDFYYGPNDFRLLKRVEK